MLYSATTIDVDKLKDEIKGESKDDFIKELKPSISLLVETAKDTGKLKFSNTKEVVITQILEDFLESLCLYFAKKRKNWSPESYGEKFTVMFTVYNSDSPELVKKESLSKTLTNKALTNNFKKNVFAVLVCLLFLGVYPVETINMVIGINEKDEIFDDGSRVLSGEALGLWYEDKYQVVPVVGSIKIIPFKSFGSGDEAKIVNQDVNQDQQAVVQEEINKNIDRITDYMFSHIHSLITFLIKVAPELTKFNDPDSVNNIHNLSNNLYIDTIDRFYFPMEKTIDSETVLSSTFLFLNISDNNNGLFSKEQFKILKELVGGLSYQKNPDTEKNGINYFFWTTKGKKYFFVVGVNLETTCINTLFLEENDSKKFEKSFISLFPDIDENKLIQELKDFQKNLISPRPQSENPTPSRPVQNQTTRVQRSELNNPKRGEDEGPHHAINQSDVPDCFQDASSERSNYNQDSIKKNSSFVGKVAVVFIVILAIVGVCFLLLKK